MKRFTSGYTLVEVVMIITVVGIISTIGVFSWNAVTVNSRDRAREADVKVWASTFDTYKARYLTYPALPVNATTPTIACLGKFAPKSSDPTLNNRCGNYTSTPASFTDTTADSILTEVAKVGSAPKNSGPSIKNQFAGPIVYLSQPSDTPPYTISANFVNYFEGNCPSGFTNVTTTAPYSTIIPTPNGARLCSFTKSFEFNPN